MALTKREARRIRNREDFVRATQQALTPSHHKALSKLGIVDQVGVNAGNTFREHLEDEIRKAVRVYHRTTDDEVKSKAARGVIRGLCKALLIYEDSYNKDDKNALARIEREFLNEGKE